MEILTWGLMLEFLILAGVGVGLLLAVVLSGLVGRITRRRRQHATDARSRWG